MKGILERQWSRKISYVMKWKLLWNSLGDRVSVGRGCDTAVTVRTRCGWVKFMECCELLYGRRFPLKLKGAVSKCYVRPGMLHDA